DLIYNPPLTPLLKIAKEKGLKVINGLSMLLHQGALSFKLWTGREAPLEVMREELYNQFKM
ncbi:MAG TPA: shikimate dehydrogenase, partial [Candidatus Omnitrophica bacterium]|nr:shikimate dehydrogenase [Candidatus Omnitrophota bacterium]